MVQFWCSNNIVDNFLGGPEFAWALWLVWTYAAQFTLSCDTLCVHLSTRTSINIFSDYCYSSSSVGLDNQDYSLTPNPCTINEPWAPMKVSLVYWLSSLDLPEPPVLETLWASCLAITFRHHKNHSGLYTCQFFLFPTQRPLGQTFQLLPNISHQLMGAIVESCYSQHLSVVIMI